MIDNLFMEISFLIVIALGVSFVMRILRQPLIIGYILTGIIVSPYAFNILNSEKSVGSIAQIGVALLLFTVGLHMNPKLIRNVGKAAFIAGLGQIVFSFGIGFGISRLLGFGNLNSLFIAMALSFSSTIIVMKLLTDKEELEALYGRITLGILIVQDLAAVAILLAISSLSNADASISNLILGSLFKGLILISILIFLGLKVLPFVTKKVAKSQELLFLFSIGWCLAIASIFNFFDFSIEVGALLAGISLSFSEFRFEMSSKLRPLRDFFLLLFFIVLGSHMDISNVLTYLPFALVFSAIVLIGNPLVVTFLMGILGYTKKNSFISGLSVSQISEFSFIIITLGLSLGYIDRSILSIMTLVGLFTIAVSTYEILYSNQIYHRISNYLSVFEKKGQKEDESKFHSRENYDAYLFGYNRIGFDLLKAFRKIKKSFLVVDYNPETISHLVGKGVDCRYGDVGDPELLKDLRLRNAKFIASTIPDFETNLLLIKHVRKVNKKATIVVVSHQIEETIELYKDGADYVVMPHFLGGYHTADLISKYGLSQSKFRKEREEHLKLIEERIGLGHHRHPKRENKR